MLLLKAEDQMLLLLAGFLQPRELIALDGLAHPRLFCFLKVVREAVLELGLAKTELLLQDRKLTVKDD